jgi:subtilase family serine protease
MRTHASVVLKGLVLSSLLVPWLPIARAQNVPLRITEAVDEAKLSVLKGSTRPEANAQNDRGRVPDSFRLEHMFLQLRRSPEQERALDQLIDQLHDSKSPSFHHWLTAQEFGERYGLAAEDLTTITGWLQSHGFAVNVVYPNGVVIDFSGTAGQVRQVFHAEIHYLDVRGVRHIANMNDPQVPTALASAIVGIVSLNDFRPHPAFTFAGCGLLPTQPSSCFSVVPADLATIYNFNPLFANGISGQGQTIVVLEPTDVFSTVDWTTFRSTFGLSSFTSGSFTQTNPAPPSGFGNCSDPGVNADDAEAILDAEWASAAAPSAAIVLASCKDTATNFGAFIALENLINGSATPPAVMSLSFVSAESELGMVNAQINSDYQQAVAEGVSVFVAAGDNGGDIFDAGASPPIAATNGIGVNGLASTPFNVAVGGTDFSDTFARVNSTYWGSTNAPNFSSALSYVPEIPWNDSCASVLIATFVSGSGTTFGSNGFCNGALGEQFFLNTSGGSGGPSSCAMGAPSNPPPVGGTCAGYTKPSWQQSFLGNPSDGVRDLPDVSLFAANGVWGHAYVVCFSDIANGGASCSGSPVSWFMVGGTSVATPIVAGIQALANQKTGSRSGNPNPTYYSLAAAEYGAGGNANCNSSLGKNVASTCIFYDVTEGDMDVPCSPNLESGKLINCFSPSGTFGVLSTSSSADQPAFGTSTGWDFATGIGTINANNLVNNWPSAPIVGQFDVSASPAALSFAAPGQFGTSTITVAGSGGFAGTVSFACSVSPLPPNDPPTCFVNPSSVALSATVPTATANLRISTTAGLNSGLQPEKGPNKPGWFAASGALAVSCIFLLGVPKRRRCWAASLGLVVLVLLGVTLSSCAGHGGSNQINFGTPAGVYTVTVTASSGVAAQSGTVSLNVQ